MKIEPLKNAKYPRYAAALAAIASAAILTGCRTAGEVETAGVAPDPTVAVQTVSPDDSDCEVVLEGELPEPTEPDEPFMLDGDVAVAEIYEDTAAFVPADALPDPAEVPQDENGANVQDFQKSYDLVRALPEEHFVCWAGHFYDFDVTMHPSETDYLLSGIRFGNVYESDERQTLLAFFDGTLVNEADGMTMAEWMQAQYTEAFDWGGYLDDEAGGYRVVFVDISAEPQGDALDAYAEQIAKDVIE